MNRTCSDLTITYRESTFRFHAHLVCTVALRTIFSHNSLWSPKPPLHKLCGQIHARVSDLDKHFTLHSTLEVGKLIILRDGVVGSHWILDNLNVFGGSCTLHTLAHFCIIQSMRLWVFYRWDVTSERTSSIVVLHFGWKSGRWWSCTWEILSGVTCFVESLCCPFNTVSWVYFFIRDCLKGHFWNGLVLFSRPGQENSADDLIACAFSLEAVRSDSWYQNWSCHVGHRFYNQRSATGTRATTLLIIGTGESQISKNGYKGTADSLKHIAVIVVDMDSSQWEEGALYIVRYYYANRTDRQNVQFTTIEVMVLVFWFWMDCSSIMLSVCGDLLSCYG